MYNTSFFKKILLIATVAVFYSCDKEFNAIGDDLIGDNHFDLEAEDYTVTTYNQKVTPVVSNNLPVNALGIYNNPVFGTTTANFNTQVTLESYAPTLGVEVAIDSVTLNIPYFSTAKSINEKGVTTYELNSIYGPEEGKIKLSVYESGILLNNYNANNYDISRFYNTDGNSLFETQATTNPNVFGTRLNDQTTKIVKDDAGNPTTIENDTSENDEFIFSPKEIKETTPATTTTAQVIKRIKPEMRLHLNKDFFKAKIFDAPASKLASDEVFKNYFKGLYFKVEKSAKSEYTRMAMMNFNGGKITIFYKSKATAEATTVDSKTLVINLTGPSTNPLNTVSLLEEGTTDYTNGTAEDDDTPDEKLYLKGGQGSMAVIKLFDETDLGSYNDKGEWITKPNSVSDELDEIRNNVTFKKWLANEANLVFTIDSQKMAGAPEPDRIYLYDLDNNMVLTDYTADRTTALNGDAKKSKAVFNGMINIDATSKRGTTYKIRITNHIRNLIKNADVKNVKLGLVVTEDINTIISNKLDKTKINYKSLITEVPAASIMSPLGTVLFGGNIPQGNSNYDKRVKLKIYYTKPN
ncbi:DUF4270 domain-containing protein [Flavobacterium pectinovorum]|uniref:DUF4270 domain-containing protein n=1 Tax=Flavobacterium pectinovorum TaxID=29533 RepID=UPI001FAE3FA5|nr:DUF4270 domain-containing protein [Flavobacterium pectinovorum]MCI9844395.1 DUF4270 domain-containing protein [Flavobacterium pectinovorum]